MIERVVNKHPMETPPSELQYWLSKTPNERVAAVEVLRRQVIGEYSGTESRLQRVCTIISR